MLYQLKKKSPFDIDNQCSLMNEYVKNDLLDVSLFEWINSDRADCFTWSLLKAGKLVIESEKNTPESDLRFRKNYSHICFNTSTNILNYITWSFDDYDNSYFSDNDNHSKNLKRFGAQQMHQKLVLKEYKERFRYVHDNNNVSWITSNNLEQTSWIYNYIIKQSIKNKYPQLNRLKEFYYIIPPNNEEQYYATVVAQLDMVCDIYSDKPEQWDVFSRKLKKAWSTQSDRLKVKNKEVMLDKACLKMLRDMVGKNASDAILKKKLKDLIQIEHTEYKKDNEHVDPVEHKRDKEHVEHKECKEDHAEYKGLLYESMINVISKSIRGKNYD